MSDERHFSGSEPDMIPRELVGMLNNYWGIGVSGNERHLRLGDGRRFLVLVTDKDAPILSRFADNHREAATFLAGLWHGHFATLKGHLCCATRPALK